MFKRLNIPEFIERFSNDDNKCSKYLSELKWEKRFQSANRSHTYYHNGKQNSNQVCSNEYVPCKNDPSDLKQKNSYKGKGVPLAARTNHKVQGKVRRDTSSSFLFSKISW